MHAIVFHLTGVDSIGKAQTLHPKRLGLSLVASNPLWWAIYKSNVSLL